MTNAKEEFVSQTCGNNVRCAAVCRAPYYMKAAKTFFLKVGYTPEEYDQFLDELDFDYDSGYGTQELYGTIWYADGSWAERADYDGSEWWVDRIVPDVPVELQGGAK